MTGFLDTGFGATDVDVGDITKSLRFRGAQYLSRIGPNVTTLTWTFSAWVKRGTLGVVQILMGSNSGTNAYPAIRFTAADQLELYSRNSSSVVIIQLTSTAVFRDPTAWYHIVCKFDSPQAVAADRFRMYVNGVEIAYTVTTSLDQNEAMSDYFPTSNEQLIGAYRTTSYAGYFDGYLSRICFVDGQALTPSSFGYLNTDINEWVSKSQSAVKAVVDAGGTNSFMLDFDNGSSLTTLGYDKSSKGNNWTLNNHSLTAGANYDWMEDRPGNSYAVLNPIGKATQSTISSANLGFSITAASAGTYYSRATIGVTTGKWYFEVIPTAVDAGPNLGIGIQSVDAATSGSTGLLSSGYAYFSNGQKYSSSAAAAYGATYTVSDVIGCAVDLDSGTIEFYKNNTTQGVAFTGITAATYAPLVFEDVGGTISRTVAGNINFGQRPFSYTPPTGFKALCQANLPTPAILNPKKHFDVKLFTANGGVNTITGVEFRPDVVWDKSRATAASHLLYDSVRGVNTPLTPNSTAAEAVSANTLPSFNADGFTLGANDNSNTSGYGAAVAWLWKAGGAAVTNTSGSITSQVSANVEAGFSVVTFQAANVASPQTVGHGLGVAPKLIIIKGRSFAGPWTTYHASIGATKNLVLNTTAAEATSASAWNNTAPTTSAFTLGSSYFPDAGNSTYVAYCFAEIPGFSKIGSYTGNGSTDGPFVFCGFKPRWVMVKRATGGISNWTLVDTARDTYNVSDAALFPDLANGEDAASVAAAIDVTSNGWKVRHFATNYNASGSSYVFIAIADTTAKFSNSR